MAAVDISPRMLEVARSKIADPRVTWHLADARSLPLADASCDRVVCYSVWPHFDDRHAVAVELRRVLRPGGSLHVWHLSGRERINEIHASAGEAVRHDLLGPVSETAAVLGAAGFSVHTAVEGPERYLVTAVLPGCDFAGPRYGPRHPQGGPHGRCTRRHASQAARAAPLRRGL